MHNPHLLDKQSVEDLQKLVKDFPYFQSAHLLLSLASKKWDASIYQNSLKKTAIVVPNRSHLFKLIHEIENETAVSLQRKENQATTDVGIAKEPSAENTKQELDILKAAEVSVEMTNAEVLEPIAAVQEKPKADAEEILEKEIANKVVNAFVEKELLKISDTRQEEAPKKEPASFVDWLALLKKNNGQSYSQIEKQIKDEREKTKTLPKPEKLAQPKIDEQADQKKLKNRAIIDKIIESGPGLIRVKEEQKFFSPDSNAKESLLENEHLVTETLAKIYALQGSVNKAVRAYEILSLKFPQKSAYFATLIQKLKNNQ